MATERAEETADQIRKMLLSIRSRAITRGAVDQAIWAIHKYSREHRNNLDSERACNGIRRLMELAVSKLQKRLEAQAIELEDAHIARRKAQKELRDLKALVRQGSSGKAASKRKKREVATR